VISLLAAAAVAGLPDISHLNEVRHQPQITYLDRTGAILGVRGGQYAAPVDVDRLPPYVPGAFVAIEDRRFYEHQGFDAIGIARALAADLAHGRIVEGASTITQQLARNLFLSPDQTLERKAQEVMLAVQLEQRYSKKQILGMYLSRVYFGGGAYGLEAASRRFYDKPASQLTVAEAAVLAGCLKSPTNYSPIDQPERSAERARLVLDAMSETGVITEAQHRRALLHPAVAHKSSATATAQYFIDWVDRQTRALIPNPQSDLTVETTLDLPLEGIAANAVTTVVAKEARRGVQQAALVSLDGEGRVRALVGGVSYANSQFDRAVEAHRQAGSAWKPFVYLTAMEAGRTPETPVVDEPVTINGWSPHNFEPEFLGPITIERAVAHSINTVAARMADEVGRDNVARTAHRLGIVSTINTDPAMALGTTLVTPLEMAQAYAPFSNGGVRATAYGIERIRVVGGRVVYQHRTDPPAQVIGNPPLSEMNAMLRDVIVEGTGTHAAIRGYDLAGKTGTTSDFKDAWFCGFSGGITTVVWVGKDDNTSMAGVTGGAAPTTLWRTYMAAALPRVRAGAIPAGPPATSAPVAPPPVAAPDAAPDMPPGVVVAPVISATPIPNPPPRESGPGAAGADPVSDLLSPPRRPPPAPRAPPPSTPYPDEPR
jgi:penicillin-binding protein 1A